MKLKIVRIRSLLKVFNHLEEFLSPSFIERHSGERKLPSSCGGFNLCPLGANFPPHFGQRLNVS